MPIYCLFSNIIISKSGFIIVNSVCINYDVENKYKMIVINGKSFKGNSVSISGNNIIIDGNVVDGLEDEKVINIKVDGNIETLDIDNCDKIDITGECGVVTSKNGNIMIKGNVSGDVTNKNGNIMCHSVGGDVETKNGNIVHS